MYVAMMMKPCLHAKQEVDDATCVLGAVEPLISHFGIDAKYRK
jgi:hypothetical protein